MTALDKKLTFGQKRQRVLRKLWKMRYAYLMLLPVLLYFALFKYWPMYWLRLAFYDFKILRGFDGSKFVGLKHFIRFFESTDFWMLLTNTLSINFAVLFFVFPIPILFALLLNEVNNTTFKKAIQTVSYLPYFISTMIVVAMINTLLSPSVGIVNRVIRSMGGESIYFMGSEKYFRPVYILSAIWQNTGWSAIVYLSALTAIDPTLYEAAIVDGAGRMRQVWHITLPGIRSTIIIMFILQLGKIMNVGFEKVYLLQNPLNLGASEVISTYLYKKGIINANYSYSTAIGLFNNIVAIILVVIANKISKKVAQVSLW